MLIYSDLIFYCYHAHATLNSVYESSYKFINKFGIFTAGESHDAHDAHSNKLIYKAGGGNFYWSGQMYWLGQMYWVRPNVLGPANCIG